MLDYKPNMVLSTQEYKVVGTRPIRHDGADKVMGRARYAADIHLPGMLHGRMLRSPHPHARIKRIDARRALALPGVVAVVTAADLPAVSAMVADQEEGGNVNYGFYSRNVMAREKALYRGHAVAAVAAISPHVAEQALALIDVEYEVLPPVFTAAEAMKPGAPVLHERLVTLANPAQRSGGWGNADNPQGTNISNRFEFRLGDVTQGFKEADVIVERQFHTKPVHQGYIEPHSATAQWNTNGSVTIWASSQGHFALRDHTSRILGLPVSQVKIVPMEIGGGFGGKGQSGCYLEPVAAALARKCGKPVKITMTRTEVFLGTGPTSGTHIRVKMGATKQGRITAAEAHLIYEAGAFPGSPVPSGCRTMFAPYQIPNAYIEGLDVVINTQKTAAYRAPGSPAAAFASEQVVDELCQRLDMDPIEFRLLNAAKEGSRQPTGPVFRKIGMVEVLQAAQAHPHLATPLVGPNRGRGIAAGAWFNGTGPASAVVSVNPDGTVTLVEGSPDIGGSRTAMAMHVAEVLGIAAEDVKPSIADTDSIGYSSGAGGSGVTFKMGTAVYQAAQDVRRQLIERAARIWEVKPEDVQYDAGELRHKNDPELRTTLAQLAHKLNHSGGPIVGRATANPAGVGNAFALNVVDVEVDPETGKVTILRFTAIQDAGKAIHPSYVEGQIQGGAVQGIGWALNEEYYLDNQGQMMNSSFLDYRMPTSLDVPMIDTVIVEVANPGHPLGVRGVGEVSLVPPMAAIANAIHRAVGVRTCSLPMNPASILEAMPRKLPGE
ncbi:MAG: xanthine dehydrogenase family protein molybdopterin-binding subunit [Dehalococcoidia bacterium]|nr:xanthine dehydrogenase family protein molybdopterin-binding subunit [Dehalococcoidia bacterium]MSQ16507.1 xanthine dehydrogenase family protein molybdopterin-binding subunit [Dehalococcoidia bacterium]